MRLGIGCLGGQSPDRRFGEAWLLMVAIALYTTLAVAETTPPSSSSQSVAAPINPTPPDRAAIEPPGAADSDAGAPSPGDADQAIPASPDAQDGPGADAVDAEVEATLPDSSAEQEPGVASVPRIMPPPATTAQLPSPVIETHGTESPPDSSKRAPYLGVGLDVGVSGILPDTGLLLTWRPVRPVHVQLGPGYNGLSPGLRGGITVINPYFFPLSLTWEGGHYFEGDANKAVRWFSDGTQDIASLRRFSYDYMNLLGGLAFENRNFTFYFRVGVTWMHTTIRDFQQSVRDLTQVDVQASDPKISYRGPTAKLGLLFFP